MKNPTSGRLALTRGVSASFERCELTHLERQPIDLGRARVEHSGYGELLAELGCVVEEIAADPGLPDCVFIEDTAVVVDEVAVMARPGAVARRRELPAVAAALARHRPLARVEAPGTLDGGDVLVAGRQVFVGCSERTNAAGLEQLRGHLAPHGYSVRGVEVRGCLHLKSAVTRIGPELLLVHRPWLAPELAATALAGFELLAADPEEPFAANALLVGDIVVMSDAFARTRRRLEARGLTVAPVAVSEIAKAEGGVTCCSILLRDLRS